MARFERALVNAEAACDLIPAEAALDMASACETFQPHLKLLGEGMARDGVTLPQFVKLLRSHVDERHADHVHFGATRQDLIDMILSLRLKDVTRIIKTRLYELDTFLDGFVTSTGLLRKKCTAPPFIMTPL